MLRRALMLLLCLTLSGLGPWARAAAALPCHMPPAAHAHGHVAAPSAVDGHHHAMAAAPGDPCATGPHACCAEMAAAADEALGSACDCSLDCHASAPGAGVPAGPALAPPAAGPVPVMDAGAVAAAALAPPWRPPELS